MDREEIVTKNKEFYCNTYSAYGDRVIHLILAAVSLILMGIVIWWIKEQVILNYYAGQASYELLDGNEEVIQWAKEQMQGTSLWSTMVVGIGFGIFGVYIAFVNLFGKNYKLYKNRKWVTAIPAGLVVMEGFVMVWAIAAGTEWRSGIIPGLCYLIPLLLSRLLTTSEVRESDKLILEIIQCLSNWILKHY